MSKYIDVLQEWKITTTQISASKTNYLNPQEVFDIELKIQLEKQIKDLIIEGFDKL